MKYLSSFLNLKCASDVIRIASPVNHYDKEISEAMGIIHRLKPIALKEPDKYIHIDLCSGNALSAVISAFLLPFQHVYAVDKECRKRSWDQILHFNYIRSNIVADDGIASLIKASPCPVIVTATHACSKLAYSIIDLYKSLDNAKHLIMMPCCTHSLVSFNVTEQAMRGMSKDFVWTLNLAALLQGSTVTRDPGIDSPCNFIITHSK
jgi:hypothetical protein